MLLVTIGATACSGDDESDAPANTAPRTAAPSPTTSPERSGEDDDTATVRRPLADVCPDTIVVQTDALPTVEHGPLYALLPAGPTFDDGGQRVSGPIRRADGTVEDITLEIRSGGPAIGFRSPLELLGDGDVDLAETSFAELVLAASAAEAAPAVGVAALTTTNHDMIMWDPDTHPSLDTIDDLREEGVEVLHVTGEPFVDFLVATGRLDADQLRPGSDGGPATFVTEDGTIARQGNALVDPSFYASLPEWGRPVAHALVSDVGWADLDDVLAITPEGRLDAECLEQLVPVIQGAIGFYADQPGPTNELISDVRTRFNPLDLLGASSLDAAARTAADGGWFLPADDRPLGSFDDALLEEFVGLLAATFAIDPPQLGVVVSNDAIDPTVIG